MPDYYQTNSQSYYQNTIAVDPESFLAPLLQFLPENAKMLDVGCGSGRDLLWLKQRGHRPTGLERSPSLAELAETASGCPVFEADFEHFDFASQEMDAIIMIGAVVHIPHSRLAEVLGGILHALKPGGVLLITLKEGDGQGTDKTGRTFYLWQENALSEIFRALGLSLLHFFRQSSALKTGEAWLGYVLRYETKS